LAALPRNVAPPPQDHPLGVPPLASAYVCRIPLIARALPSLNALFVLIRLPPTYAAWRFANFNSTSKSGRTAETTNPDGDAWSNAEEYIWGTNPNTTSFSTFHLATHNKANNTLTLTFTSARPTGFGCKGRTHIVDVKSTATFDCDLDALRRLVARTSSM